MIFEDPQKKRWHRALLVFSLLVVAAAIASGLMVAGVFVPPPVTNPFSSRPTMKAAKLKDEIEKKVRPSYTKKELRRREWIRFLERKRRLKLVEKAQAGPMPLPENVVVAFTLADDPLTIAHLERHIGNIDVVVPDWFELPGTGCELNEKVDAATRRLLDRAGVLVFPRLVNFNNGKWKGDETGVFLRNDQARACLTAKLVDRLVALKAEGINIDLEELAPEDSEPLLELLVELRSALHAKGLRLTVDVSFYNQAYDIEFIGDVSDAVMVMVYDQHFPLSRPGPIASRDWIADSVDDILPRLPPDRVVMVLGAYGYDWILERPQLPADSVSFSRAMDLASAAGAQPLFEIDDENTRFGYQDLLGLTHEVWFEDALAIWNQYHALKRRHVSRFGLWRVGAEDESMWRFFGSDQPISDPNELATIGPGHSFEFIGQGEVLSVRARPRGGTRKIFEDADGLIEQASYSQVPSGFLVERRGGSGKNVVLTFDDGPDEEWTPKLLSALADLKVPATFFVVGEQAARFPEIVQEIADRGHIVANHSYFHPHFDQLTPDEVSDELSATQRLIEGLIGSSTPLFRPPYSADIDSESVTEIASARAALENAYVVVGSSVDSTDWKRQGVSAIANSVVDGVTRRNNRVILLHDGGGDRSQTVAAVREFVPRLRELGYQFVPLDQFLGIPGLVFSKSLPWSERLISGSTALLALIKSWGWTILAALFFFCTVISIVRILLLGSLTLRDLRRPTPRPPVDFKPAVTVLVPAFNEEKVIESTVRSLLTADCPNLDVLVIDDGSKDQTAAVVAAIAATEPRVRIIPQANAGKAAAANLGLKNARGEIVVAVDADTVIPADSISKLVRHFFDPTVTAVCGNVEVGNVNRLITTFQAIEYVTSQNFDRRAFSAINCISVVPGALGAWRRQAVLDAGGYSRDTLTEDADLTLTILERGGKVVYEAEAFGRTEAPESLSALLRQRFRWTYGTYQCIWKHRTAFFHGSLGWVGLPNMVLFQIVFPALSPIGDVVMVMSIFRGDWRAFLAGYLAFLAMDLCGSLLAFTLDRKPVRWLALLLVQRFTYRQIMYYVSLKAMLAALRGARHGWRKLDRTGTVVGTSQSIERLAGAEK
jgi:peptidoglycan-N-acetylglucosamine deacetylase